MKDTFQDENDLAWSSIFNSCSTLSGSTEPRLSFASPCSSLAAAKASVKAHGFQAASSPPTPAISELKAAMRLSARVPSDKLSQQLITHHDPNINASPIATTKAVIRLALWEMANGPRFASQPTTRL